MAAKIETDWLAVIGRTLSLFVPGAGEETGAGQIQYYSKEGAFYSSQAWGFRRMRLLTLLEAIQSPLLRLKDNKEAKKGKTSAKKTRR